MCMRMWMSQAQTAAQVCGLWTREEKQLRRPSRSPDARSAIRRGSEPDHGLTTQGPNNLPPASSSQNPDTQGSRATRATSPSSWPALSGQPRLLRNRRRQDVDARDKRGHDGHGVASGCVDAIAVPRTRRGADPGSRGDTCPPLPRHGRAWPGHPRLLRNRRRQDVDARDKRGHDGHWCCLRMRRRSPCPGRGMQ